MTASRRSVIEIDVQDSTFKKFADAFSRYTVALKTAISDSKKLGEENTAASEAGVSGAKAEEEAIQSKRKTRKKADDEAKTSDADAKKRAKETADAEKRKNDDERRRRNDREKAEKEQIKRFKDLAKWSGSVAKNIASGSLSLAKWGILGAVGGGFGLAGLGLSASETRRTSQGLGISSGDLRAARVNFGNYLDPEGALTNIANAQSDVSKRWIFNALGENTEGKSSAQILPELLPKIIAAFKQGGSTLQGADAKGLTQLVGIEDLRRLSTLTQNELSKTIAAYEKDRQALDINDSTNRDWQEFMVSLHRAGQTIEKDFIQGLRPLLPYLEKFSQKIVDGIKAFLSSDKLEPALKAFGDGIVKLGEFLGSKEFHDDVVTFLKALHAMAQWMAKTFFGEKKPTTTANLISKGVYGESTDDLEKAFDQVDHAKKVATLEKQYGLGSLLDKVWANESSRGAHAGLSKAGALGDFQFLSATGTQYGVTDRTNFDQSSEGAAKYLKYLLGHYAGDAAKALAAYNWGEGNLDKDIKDNGNNWFAKAPEETRKYVTNAGLSIHISDSTGGNTATTVAALRGGR